MQQLLAAGETLGAHDCPGLFSGRCRNQVRVVLHGNDGGLQVADLSLDVGKAAIDKAEVIRGLAQGLRPSGLLRVEGIIKSLVLQGFFVLLLLRRGFWLRALRRVGVKRYAKYQTVKTSDRHHFHDGA